MTKYWLGKTRKAKAAEVKTGNQIDKIKLQMHPDLKSLSVIQFMFLLQIVNLPSGLVWVWFGSGLGQNLGKNFEVTFCITLKPDIFILVNQCHRVMVR